MTKVLAQGPARPIKSIMTSSLDVGVHSKGGDIIVQGTRPVNAFIMNGG